MNNTYVKQICRLALVIGILFLFLAIPAFSSFSNFSSTRVHAQWVQSNYGVDNDAAKLTNEVNMAAYSSTSWSYSLLNLICAIIPFKGPNMCYVNGKIGEEMYKKSAVGNINSAVAMLITNPPADFGLWLADTGSSLGFIPRQAYAQGIGFNGLTPLLPIWKAFRNIAYVLLALSMIVIGFMVMLRKKIDPKTVVTVQNALPRIVLALILITFSYAIVGLLIDAMYLIIAFINVVVKSSFANNTQLNGLNLTSGGFFEFLKATFGPVSSWNPLNSIGQDFNNQDWLKVAGDLVVGGSGLGLLFQGILALAYLFAFIRILLLLLNSYTQILLAVLTGPLQILIDVFPGANGFTTWFKNILANLVVFPITVFLLLLGNLIASNFASGTLWIPPLLPQFFGASASLAVMLISLGIILSIPNVANGIKEQLKAKSPIDAGPGVIFGPIARGTGTLLQTAYQFSMVGTFLGFGRGGHGKQPPHS